MVIRKVLVWIVGFLGRYEEVWVVGVGGVNWVFRYFLRKFLEIRVRVGVVVVFF